MSDNEEKPDSEPASKADAPGKGLLTSGFLQDPLAERKDIAMLSNILKRNRFEIPEDIRTECVRRLAQIASKEYVDVMTKEGPVALDGPADVTAVAAIRVIGMFEAMNQKDQHKLIDVEMKKGSAPAGNTYNIGSIAIGKDPVSIEQARTIASEAVAKVMGRLSPPPVVIEAESKPVGGLDDV